MTTIEDCIFRTLEAAGLVANPPVSDLLAENERLRKALSELLEILDSDPGDYANVYEYATVKAEALRNARTALKEGEA